VRRSRAIVLLAVFSFSLIGPAVFAGAQAKLPSCCTRSGKHHCSSISGADAQDSTSGAALRQVPQRCPYYPNGGAVPVHSYAALRESSLTFFAALLSHPAAHAQTEARYRASFSRSRQKRGPPVLPC
jgi:hypothetical protein